MSEQEKQALVISLRLLAATPKTREHLAQKLQEKGFSGDIVEGTLNQLEAQGLLNDRSLAQSLLQSYIYHRPSGRRRIAFEMRKRGIKDSLVKELLERYPLGEERERALELARARQLRWKKLEGVKRRKKIYDFLVRRGFDFGLSREVVGEVEKEEALDE